MDYGANTLLLLYEDGFLEVDLWKWVKENYGNLNGGKIISRSEESRYIGYVNPASVTIKFSEN